jgi:hypothetical protein
MPENNELLRELDRDVVALKVSHAQLAVTVAALTQQAQALQQTTKELTDTLNRGRGALWGIMFIAGAIGSVVPTALKWILGK